MHIISGIFKNQTLASPKGLQTRPTSSRLRETLFNICQNDIETAHFLDLFAGSGAMGLEALSRGAEKATFIDNSKESTRCIQANIAKLKVATAAEVMYGDVFALMQKLQDQKRSYQLIYADPPYEAKGPWKQDFLSYSNIVLKIIDEGTLLSAEGMLFIEDSIKSPLQNDELSTLTLKSSRRMGRSVLHQYVKKR